MAACCVRRWDADKMLSSRLQGPERRAQEQAGGWRWHWVIQTVKYQRGSLFTQEQSRQDPYDVVKGPFISPNLTSGIARHLQSQKGESLGKQQAIYVPQVLSVNGWLNLRSGGQSRWLRSQKAQMLLALGKSESPSSVCFFPASAWIEGVAPANYCSEENIKINPFLSASEGPFWSQTESQHNKFVIKTADKITINHSLSQADIQQLKR